MTAMIPILREGDMSVLTTATGGVLEDVKSREAEEPQGYWREIAMSELTWNMLSRQCSAFPQRTVCVPGARQQTYCKKAPRKPKSIQQLPWKGSSGGIVAITLGQGVTEDVDIDAKRGPKVLQKDGSIGFMLEPGKTWSSLPSYDQKMLAMQAAKTNQHMRPVVQQFKDEMAKREEVRAFLDLPEKDRRRARCEAEQAKPHSIWTPLTFAMVQNNHTKVAPGILYGLEFPWNEQKLEEFGPSWLTKAFHTAGSLEKTNAVTQIILEKRIKIDAGNNAGKFLFEVRYKYPRKDLHTKLFAKCPFAMTKETSSDRMSSSVLKQPMDFAEINTYRLLESFFPMKTPKFYYGDISSTTSNFILITERIPYTGYDGVSRDTPLKPFEVEGPYDKCKDWQLRGSAKEYYMLLMRSHAMIAGLDKSGKLASEMVKKTGLGYREASNPAEFSVKPNACSGDEPGICESKLKVAIKFFSETAKVIFPEYVTSENFKTKFMNTMMKGNAYRQEIAYEKHGRNADYAAFGHLNLNADNAYFWKNGTGELECGVIDWGGFGYGSLGHKIWWTFNCADYENFKDNLSDYLDVFIDTYQEYGGPKLDREVLFTHLILTCIENSYYMVQAVPNCFLMCPEKEWQTITDRHDPRISGNIDGKSTLRTTLHVLNNGIRVIEEMQADGVLDKWIQDVWVAELRKTAKTREMIYS